MVAFSLFTERGHFCFKYSNFLNYIFYFILFIYIYIFTSQLFLKCKTLKSNKVDADVGYVVRIEINKLKTIALSIHSIYSRNCFVSGLPLRISEVILLTSSYKKRTINASILKKLITTFCKTLVSLIIFITYFLKSHISRIFTVLGP